MSTTLCDISALFFYRIPPCLFELMPEYPDLSTRSGRCQLRHYNAYLDYIPIPLHELVFSRNDRRNARYIKQHLTNSPRSSAGSIEVGAYLSLTSPLATLLSLASHLPVEQLCMIMYEFCGTFAPIKLTLEHQDRLQSLVDAGQPLCFGGWEPVLTSNRKLTNLWKRPPLVTIDELKRFADTSRGLRGCKRFAKAASMVFGIAASPFEVQAAMRLCAPRSMGGEGLGPAELNHRIRLDAAARSIAQREHCYADLYFEPTNGSKPLVIECQSKLVHDSRESAISDSDRSTALQSMGYNVIFVTSHQISDQRAYQNLRTYVAHELGVELRPKTQRQIEAERSLCRNLFVDWTTLGLQSA